MRSAGSTGVGKWGSFYKGVLELKKINDTIYLSFSFRSDVYRVGHSYILSTDIKYHYFN